MISDEIITNCGTEGHCITVYTFSQFVFNSNDVFFIYLYHICYYNYLMFITRVLVEL